MINSQQQRSSQLTALSRLFTSTNTRFVLVLLLSWLLGCAGSSGGRQAPEVNHNGTPGVAAAMTITAVKVLKPSGGRVDWSPRGGLIAFDRQGEDGYYDVYIMRQDGLNEYCLTCDRPEFSGRHAGNPAWHPSGKWLVFQAEKQRHPGASFGALPGLGKHHDLWLTSRDGTRLYRLTALPESKDSGVLHPHFSPTGHKLSWSEMHSRSRLFKSNQGAGLWTLKVADFKFGVDGPVLANIKSYQPGGPAFYENHGFSPDASKLIFTSNFKGGGLFKDTKIYTLDLRSFAVTLLTEFEAWNEHASYTPDGRFIVWGTSFGNQNKGMDWWLMAADGSNQQRLSYFNDPASANYAGFSLAVDHSWSPDGSQFVGYVQDSMIRQSGRIVLVSVRRRAPKSG